nr:immunoglobulin light chain junction region [Macaca mulatta]MOV96797.1 immunoglobulin light chain junction region [Macaca mulatta]MOW01133.1 immunoglobulin light chain junction region [Macaca mulatta]MOW01260.1 immunoglobulin light chain junction region [Macaca mulatta]
DYYCLFYDSSLSGWVF